MVVMQAQMRIFVAHRQIRPFPGSNKNRRPQVLRRDCFASVGAAGVTPQQFVSAQLHASRPARAPSPQGGMAGGQKLECGMVNTVPPCALVRRRLPGAAGRGSGNQESICQRRRS